MASPMASARPGRIESDGPARAGQFLSYALSYAGSGAAAAVPGFGNARSRAAYV